jgi:hypothetical protein
MGRMGRMSQIGQLRPVSYGRPVVTSAHDDHFAWLWGTRWMGWGRIMPLTREINVRLILGVMPSHVDVLHHGSCIMSHRDEGHHLLISVPRE